MGMFVGFTSLSPAVQKYVPTDNHLLHNLLHRLATSLDPLSFTLLAVRKERKGLEYTLT